MKKLYLLPVLLFLVLTSCKKDKGDPLPSASELIKGSWLTVSQERKYYDEANQLVHEEAADIENVFSFDGSTYDSGDGTSGTYNISQTGDRAYISLSQGNVAEQFEITAISEDAMIWQSERVDVPYYNNGIKSAARSVSTINFSRQ